MSLLRCEKITKSFGGVRALDSINLDFPKSQIVALIGPNGAGKSTLIDVITGFLPPEEGRCLVNEIDTTRWAVERVAALGVARTFQEVRVFPEMTVFDNVVMGIPADATENVISIFRPRFRVRLEATKRDLVDSGLRTVGLQAKADDLAKSLSYGQQKLLSLAMCIVSRAKIILLDEPFTGLDPEIAGSVISALQELRALERLVVFVEHDLIAVERIADQVHLLAGGRLVESGSAAQVLNSRDMLKEYFG